MIILLSNDDGIDAPGLAAFEEALCDHELWVVAPHKERSGKSHSITLRDPVCFKSAGKRRFACTGTPADCVLYSINGAIPVQPDIIISGVNRGPNLGTDIIYSGTAAVARQAALSNIPSVATSTANMQEPYPYKEAAAFVAKNLEGFLEHWGNAFFWNVNFPVAATKARITFPSQREYRDKLLNFEHPGGDIYYFLTGGNAHSLPAAGSDYEAVNDGYISVSPVFLHPINHDHEAGYEHILFKE